MGWSGPGVVSLGDGVCSLCGQQVAVDMWVARWQGDDCQIDSEVTVLCFPSNRRHFLATWASAKFSLTETQQEGCVLFPGPKPAMHINALFFCLFRAVSSAYGGSQARGLKTGAVAPSLCHARSEPSIHHSSWQHGILHPLSEARDGT